MPRPTRSRVAAARRGGEASEFSDPANAPVAVPAEANEAVIRSDETDIYGVSDREVERQRQEKENATTTANNNSRYRSSRPRAASAALSASRARRDAAMARLNDLTSTTTDAVDSPVVEMGRKDASMDASSLLGGGKGGRGELSRMEINDSEIFGNLDSSFDATAPGEAPGSHTGNGTRSADTSAFNVSVFRRTTRRRQSSIVGKDDAPIRPSSRGPTTPGLSSTFSLGNFKRRQRQPSILMSSAQKASLGLQRSRAASAASGDENENAVESEAEESFLPEAEGTPIRLSRGRGSGVDVTEAETEAQDVIARETRSRKRKSTETRDDGAAKRQAVEAEAEVGEDEEEVMQHSVENDDHSSPPSFVGRIPRTPLRLDDDILAPPASSSREGSPMIWPSLKNLGKKHQVRAASRAQTPMLDGDISDFSEPPSLTHSPNFGATRPPPEDKRRESPKLSTADLEALLPRRRRKAPKEDYDMEEESSAPEQELPRRAHRKKPPRPLNGSSKENRTNQAQAEAAAAPTRRATRRKYGSRSFDKENTAQGDSIEATGESSTPLDDTAFEAGVNEDTATTVDLSDELKAASRKFREVDEWELEYEEVVDPSSDLPEGR